MSDQLSRLKQAAHNLLVDIDLSTDCMSNQIMRERIDPQLEALEHILGEDLEGGKLSFSVQELRPEVLAFALLMEARLREKDAEWGGNSWDGTDIGNLHVCATAKVFAIETAILKGPEQDAIKHSVDLANYAMMIADKAGALDAPELERKADNGGVGWVGLDQVQMS